jgi:hypothetical protein
MTTINNIAIIMRLDFILIVVIALVAPLLLAAPSSQSSQASSSSSSSSATGSGSDDGVCEVSAETGETTCIVDDDYDDDDDDNEEGSATPPTSPDADKNVEVVFINTSQYRLDMYWDDGRFGSLLGILELEGRGEINTFFGHSFFVTMHGTKEGLFDLETDVQYKFKVTADTTATSQQTFVIPKDAAPSSNPCQDRFSVCEAEAQRGACWDSPGWMIVHCCRSCDDVLEASKLIDREIRCSKERLNITEPAWHPGDLDKLFVSWVTDPKFAKFQPQVWSSPEPSQHGDGAGIEGPWVITFDNFLTDAEADALINGGRMMGFERSTDQGAMNALGEREKIVSRSRTSSNAWCTGQCESLPEVRSATKRIEEVTGIPQTNYESFQILEYGENQFYKSHHDSSGGKDDSPSGHRILTFFLYLSDVEEGGETMFNRLGIEVKPKKGRALVWSSVKNENPSIQDNRMYHEAKPVIRGKKFAANHWIHMNDYLGPNIWGCTGSFS